MPDGAAYIGQSKVPLQEPVLHATDTLLELQVNLQRQTINER